MKKIFLILYVLFLFFICSCKEKTINITLINSEELKSYMSFNLEYEISNKEVFNFPNVERNLYITETSIKENNFIIYTKNIETLNFYGWEDENNKIYTDNSVELKKDTTFTPKYNIDSKSYSVKLMTYGVEISNTNSVEISNFVLPTIENENYTFEGWFYNELYIGTPLESLAYSQINENTILYAKLIPTLEYVNSLINGLPEKLTIFDIENIELAKNCYNKLSYQDKQLIDNYPKLQKAYDKIDDLYVAYEFYEQLVELYVKEVTANLKKELDMLIEVLDDLEEEIKVLIPNLDYDKIQELVDDVNYLYEQFAKDAIAFDKKIAQLPILMEQYYEKEIIFLYEEYQNLDYNVKVLLNADEKLNTLYQNLQELNNAQVIYYMNTSNTNNVYTSKRQLFEAFFTDFYYYIAAYHGLDHLRLNNLKNVNDFVTLAGDFKGAGANNLYGIGNIAGRYLLEKDINGILENQTENGFFGFCYKNDLYQDVLPFFINFFAYWRIDEHYANTSNYGADIFAESWAPTVDIAKFFYYDEYTSYVQTERMIDCLTNTASVVYNFSNNENLPLIKMRGYIFEGWYDNEEFSGSSITTISETNSKKLYAKWIIDEEQTSKDSANLVDVYIYNLTTSKAVVNKTTVGYVEKMYNNLSEKGKTLVKNYSTFKTFLTKYN